MKNLNIGSIKIPVTAATKSFAVLAKRGAGKTYASAVIAEEFAKAGVPFVVFDPIDVWWGLRLAADGKGKGLPIVVFGLEHADIKIDRTMGKRIAEAVVSKNISCVISTFGMSKVDQRHLIAEFSETLLNINNTPRHIFIEEAHEFVPQRVMGGVAVCFSRVEALVTMGRNKGIGVTLINQRAATLNKDVLTQVDTLIALRSVGPQDRKAVKEWVEAHSVDGDMDEFIDSLPSLPTGTAWIWSPEFMGVFEKIKIRKRETFHPDREKLGHNFEMPKLNQTDIQGFIDTFTKKEEPVTSPKPQVRIGTIHEPVKLYTQEKVDKLIASSIVEGNKKWQAKMKKAYTIINQYKEIISKATKILNPVHSFEIEPLTAEDMDAPGVVVHKPIIPFIDKAELSSTGTSGLDKCPRMIYSFLWMKQNKAYTNVQIAVATNYSVTSGGFKNALSKLVISGLISRVDGRYAIANMVESIASYRDEDFSIEGWLNNLDKCPREIFKFLLEKEEYNEDGDVFTKESIAEATNYSVDSGGFKNALSKLKTLGFIEKNDVYYSVNRNITNL